MSQQLRKLADASKKPNLTRQEIIALAPALVFDDGVTKQAFKDETNIVKIMARADKLGTISHLQKFEGVYADFADFDFFEQTQKLTQGREIFDELPAEVRKEFGQSPAAFFAYVNDPKNADDLAKKLPNLARPGKQMASAKPQDADTEAAEKAASEPLASVQKPTSTAAAESPTPAGDPPAGL